MELKWLLFGFNQILGSNGSGSPQDPKMDPIGLGLPPKGFKFKLNPIMYSSVSNQRVLNVQMEEKLNFRCPLKA